MKEREHDGWDCALLCCLVTVGSHHIVYSHWTEAITLHTVSPAQPLPSPTLPGQSASSRGEQGEHIEIISPTSHSTRAYSLAGRLERI